MSDRLRMTGMYSGMDTESIIQSLVSAKSQKVTTLKNDQKKLEWKQTAWQDLNKKIYSLYTGTLSNMRLSGSYAKRTTKCSDPTKATVVASDGAVNGTQTLQVKQIAKSGYLTGAKFEPYTETVDGKETKKNYTVSDKLSKIDNNLVGSKLTITVGKGDEAKTTDIEITGDMTINQFTAKLKEAGVNASFDENNQRFFISSTGTGTDKDFSFSAESESTLNMLGLTEAKGASKIEAQDAKIVLNNVEFTSDSNTFSINGLTITANGVTADGEELSITTNTDYDGIYDMVKDFIDEYNDIINEMYKLYNADSARKYDMLTEEQKESMSDDEVEKWEDTIKGSLLRRDNDLYQIMNTMRDSINKGYSVGDKTLHIFDFGIETLSWFESDDNEKYALHIDGDADDEKTSTKEDKLKKAIASNPEETIQFFADMCKDMYTAIDTTMQRTDYRSMYKVYDDKRLQKEYDNYTKRIKEAEDAVSAYEDKWYDKFSAMETALSKLQSNQNTIASMLGNG